MIKYIAILSIGLCHATYAKDLTSVTCEAKIVSSPLLINPDSENRPELDELWSHYSEKNLVKKTQVINSGVAVVHLSRGKLSSYFSVNPQRGNIQLKDSFSGIISQTDWDRSTGERKSYLQTSLTSANGQLLGMKDVFHVSINCKLD